MPKILKKISSGRGVVIQVEGADPLILSPANPLVVEFRVDEEIDRVRFTKLCRAVTEWEARALLSRKLAIKPRSVSEALRILQAEKLADDIAKHAIRDFTERGILDDTTLARDIVVQTLRDRPAGRSYLIALLRRRGIDAELATETVGLALAGADESELALAILRKRWTGISRLTFERARTKSYTLLSRRGIGYEAARSAFERLANEGSSFAERASNATAEEE